MRTLLLTLMVLFLCGWGPVTLGGGTPAAGGGGVTVFTESFDPTGTTGDCTLADNSTDETTGWGSPTVGTGATVDCDDTTQAKSGQSVLFTDGTGDSSMASIAYSPAISSNDVCLKFDVRWSSVAGPGVFGQAFAQTGVFALRHQGAGTVRLQCDAANGGSTAGLAADTWYKMELQFNRSTGAASWWLDDAGSPTQTCTGASTPYAAPTSALFYQKTGTNSNVWYDDIVVTDGPCP